MISYFQSVLESIFVRGTNETHGVIPDGYWSLDWPFSGERKH